MEIKIISEFGKNSFYVTASDARRIIGLAMELHRDEEDSAVKNRKAEPAPVPKPEAMPEEPEPVELDLSQLRQTKKASRVENLFGSDWKGEHKEEKPVQKREVDPGIEAEYVKGFIIAKCEKCGKIKGYCTKEYTNAHTCECGHETFFHDMKQLYLDCKCGSHFKYQTNLQTSEFSYKCINCGAEVDLKLNSRRTAYTTIGGGVLKADREIARKYGMSIY